MTCPFSSKEEVYQHVCDFLKSNPSKSDINSEVEYLSNLYNNQCANADENVKNAIKEAATDLVNLYFGAETLDNLINKYCGAVEATLNISTDPSGASVYVDDEFVGTT